MELCGNCTQPDGSIAPQRRRPLSINTQGFLNEYVYSLQNALHRPILIPQPMVLGVPVGCSRQKKSTPLADHMSAGVFL